ncbi:GT2 family glycosyltransferase [Parabacteroides sp. PFB2-10]|uniref:glycosyltransferase family 2 protein n=1 Tax=Parabacteroides sp. PFB2-10 TaxID=1742405 RepID=UPI002475FC6D|nr:glycosyltransferase family 2 protein [Parabacteroides sp. PFB2-10]MDH6313842.1 GT2 family glycosyltransferase [Parabacteroides sp. PFB2-10]MDL2244920.1 glycosyltransferase family 2 protein [Parabacteroides sp. OttesenSCG-928-J18]
MKKVSIVILNWNGSSLMKRFLPSVVAHSPEEIAEIVVADNGSTDDSLAMLAKEFPGVRVIALKENYGFAEGYNRALAEITTPYTVLLNSDVEVTPHWLEAPLKALDTEQEIAAVQPKILAEKERDCFEYAGASGGFIDRYGYPFCRGRMFHVIEKDEGQYDTPCDILWGSGAALFIRTDVYRKEGGLDAGFFAHQEEIDLCWRLRTRGYRLVCLPDSVVYHVGGATLNQENPRKTFLNFRNNLLMLYKNLPEERLRATMRLRFWLDYLAALQFLLTGQFANVRAVYRARKAFRKLRTAYLPLRRENLQKATNPFPPEILSKSLLVTFYLKGKKRYGEIDFL